VSASLPAGLDARPASGSSFAGSSTARSAAGTATAPVVSVEGIVKRYGATPVLDGASCEVRPGVTGLLGANGAGKTTLLGLMLGLHRAQEGRIEVLGLDPRRAGPEVRARVGYSPEHHLLPPDVPADDFVRHLAEVHGLPSTEATSRASDALWWVGLGEERFRALGTMSTGQRQRVKLAGAIAHDPDLVFLDEPTDGLDPTQRETMLDLIRRVGSEFGISVLLSSHLLDEVQRTCDRIVMLDGGRVVAEGPIAELRGGTRGVRVELDGPADRLAAAVARRGYTAEADGSRLAVHLPDGVSDPTDLLRVLRDELANGGAGIRRLEPQVRTLEDLFLDLDRHDLVDR
jgi:ABC-2 type transport system ATP-binding protein